MAKDLFNKYIWLVDTIYRTQEISFDEINERWMRTDMSNGKKLPLRTFHNWRDAIEQIFDINIECNRHNGYSYYIENTDDIKEGSLRSWLLNTFAVNNLINESHHLKDRILFENIPSGQQFLSPIIEAMRDSFKIELIHQSYWYDKPNTYTVRPYCLKIFKQRWYVIGFCEERSAIRIFSLDRIKEFHTLKTKFTYPKDFNPTAYFMNCFGIITDDSKTQIIRIKVYDMHCQYVRALPLHHTQQEVETTKAYAIFEYYLKPTFDFKQEILSRGADVEVLSPLSFREEIMESIQEMASHYRI